MLEIQGFVCFLVKTDAKMTFHSYSMIALLSSTLNKIKWHITVTALPTKHITTKQNPLGFNFMHISRIKKVNRFYRVSATSLVLNAGRTWPKQSCWKEARSWVLQRCWMIHVRENTIAWKWFEDPSTHFTLFLYHELCEKTTASNIFNPTSVVPV